MFTGVSQWVGSVPHAATAHMVGSVPHAATAHTSQRPSFHTAYCTTHSQGFWSLNCLHIDTVRTSWRPHVSFLQARAGPGWCGAPAAVSLQRCRTRQRYSRPSHALSRKCIKLEHKRCEVRCCTLIQLWPSLGEKTGHSSQSSFFGKKTSRPHNVAPPNSYTSSVINYHMHARLHATPHHLPHARTAACHTPHHLPHAHTAAHYTSSPTTRAHARLHATPHHLPHACTAARHTPHHLPHARMTARHTPLAR